MGFPWTVSPVLHGIGWTGGIWWDQVVHGITTESPTCPTWYSGIGRTGGMVGPGGTWDSRGQSHLSYMVQWDRTDRWDMVDPGGTWDSHGQSHLSYMVQWGMVDPGRTVDSHGPSMVQWDSHVCRMDSDGKHGRE